MNFMLFLLPIRAGYPFRSCILVLNLLEFLSIHLPRRDRLCKDASHVRETAAAVRGRGLAQHDHDGVEVAFDSEERRGKRTR